MSSRFAVAAGWLAATTLPAYADVFGQVDFASDRVERGVSQSDHRASLSVGLGYAHRSGVKVSLAATTVSDTQFEGSSGYKLTPELAWDGEPAPDWHAGVADCAVGDMNDDGRTPTPAFGASGATAAARAIR